MVTIQFLIFLSIVYFIGRGIKISINYFEETPLDKEYFGLKENFYYPIYALFFIGNLIVITNFFVKSTNFLIYFLIVFLLVINFTKINKIKISLNNILSYIIAPIFLSVSALGSGLHKDMLLYHLNYQNWINTEKLVIGLSNINGRYGFSSLHDYISSILWIGDNFLLLNFLNLSFYFVLFNFLTINILNKKSILFKSSLFIIIFGILDNFGLEGGRNGFLYIEGAGKQDSAFSILFYISNILLINAILNKKVNNSDFLISCLLVAFSIQLRILGIVTLIPLGYYFYLLNKTTINSYIRRITLLLPLTFVGVVWGLKNILISGCLLYPVEITCINSLNWYIADSATYEAGYTENFYGAFTFGDNLLSWFNTWSQLSNNYTVSINFLGSILLIIIFKYIVFKYKKNISLKYIFFLSVYIIFIYSLWITNAPAIRLGMGIFLLNIGLLGLGSSSFRFEFTNKLVQNKTHVLLLIFCIFTIPRFSQYEIYFANPFYDTEITINQNIELKKNDLGWGFIPIGTDECSLNKECVPYKTMANLYKTKNFNYKIFRLHNY